MSDLPCDVEPREEALGAPEMVERVARALHWRSEQRRRARAALAPEYVPETWERQSPGRKRDFLEDARAAMTAMVVPTPKMLAETVQHVGPPSPADFGLALRAVDHLPPSEHPDLPDILAEMARDWLTMVSAALSMGPE